MGNLLDTESWDTGRPGKLESQESIIWYKTNRKKHPYMWGIQFGGGGEKGKAGWVNFALKRPGRGTI